MGRYKDYRREPRSGGYDDDQRSEGRAAGARSDYSKVSASNASEALEAIVKWFNAEKGFGFVAVVGGSEAFMHIRQLEAAGHSSLPDGARLKVRIVQGQKGPEVIEVTEVDVNASRLGSSAERRPASPSQARTQVVSTGTVKVYKTDRGFGFIGLDGGGKDVFVHATTLARAGLSGLAEGQRVRMKIGQGQKGLEAQTIELLD
jgi:cold shock protein